MKKISKFAFIIFALACLCIQADAEGLEGKMLNKNRIQPYSENPRYWQYKGKPVLLLGGSKDDNLFQIPDLKEHLDLLASVGGNYVRNTMSDRKDKGFEVYPFKKLPDGKYDLNQWNDEYWKRFDNLLKWTGQRDIIVQIEVWDRFDYTDCKGSWKEGPWSINPYKPSNNISYTYEESGLAETYPDHPGADKQPFFHTIPGVDDNTVVRQFQEAFVDKMLSYSLPCGNVLYCMNNETSTDLIWGQYWMGYIKSKAAEAGVDVYVTDMFDVGWDLDTEEKFLLSFDNPDIYTFLDISQNTGNQNTFKKQWQNILFVRDRIKDNPRPINNTKNYGNSEWPPNSNYHKRTWHRWTTESAVQRYVLNVIGGCASTRFHRNPVGGLGLTKPAQNCIKSLRKLESLVKMWELTPGNDLLTDYEDSKVFLSANPGKTYALFFLEGGSANLNLTDYKGNFSLKWINPFTGQWGQTNTIIGGKKVKISTPKSGAWVALLVEGTTLPYGNRQRGMRVVHDNDQTRDVYTDEILMAMASAGRIQLTGLITTRTVNGIGYDKYDELVSERKQMVDLARKSGMRHIPDPVKGPSVSLQPPGSEKIEDTKTIGSDGSWLIVCEARKASSNDPLIVICGGQLTAVADDYLLDPSIEDKVIVAALLGSDKDMSGFNGKQDPWADYIVLQRLTYVQFPQSWAIPKVPKEWLRKTLPDTPLRQWMLAKIHPLFPDQLPADEDNDGQPVLPLLTTDYVIEVKRVAFGGWKSERFGKGSVRIPTFVSVPPNGESRAYVVVKANRDAGTQAWQAAMADPAAWR